MYKGLGFNNGSEFEQFLFDKRKSAIKPVEQAIKEISETPPVSPLAILNYNYFHTMWMCIYLNSRESSYIDEFIVEQKNDVETKVADIKNSGEMVGEIPFFVERQRYFSG